MPIAPIIRNQAPERSAINEDLSSIRGRLNPVREMQLLGRSNDANNDDVSKSYLLNSKEKIMKR